MKVLVHLQSKTTTFAVHAGTTSRQQSLFVSLPFYRGITVGVAPHPRGITVNVVPITVQTSGSLHEDHITSV